MKTCQYCKINVGGTAVKCPLCQNRLSGEATTDNWPAPSTLQKESILYRLQLFLIVTAVIVSLSLDFLFNINNGFHWSILLALWFMAFEFGIIRLFKRHFSSARIVTLFAIMISTLLLITGFYTMHFYVICYYVIPLICIGTMITNFIFVLVEQISNAMIYLLCNIIIGILPYIVLIAIGHTIPTLWIVCLLVSIVTFFGAYIFRGRQVIGELQKRLHM